MTITIRNIHKKSIDDIGGIYIGRMNSKFHYGNPFSHLESPNLASIKVASREIAVDCYDMWLSGRNFNEVELERRLWILDHLHLLKDQILECFCDCSYKALCA